MTKPNADELKPLSLWHAAGLVMAAIAVVFLLRPLDAADTLSQAEPGTSVDAATSVTLDRIADLAAPGSTPPRQ